MNENTEPKFATLDEVVMQKADLIAALKKNKEKHDTLFEVSVSGYWELANTKLTEKKTKLQSSLDEFKNDLSLSFTRLETDINGRIEKLEQSVVAKEQLPGSIGYENFIFKAFKWDNNLALTYPVNHSDDYADAIALMESSIYEVVKLTVNQYKQYVLNNWEWKNQFVQSTNFFLNSVTGCYYTNAVENTLLCSGYLPAQKLVTNF